MNKKHIHLIIFPVNILLFCISINIQAKTIHKTSFFLNIKLNTESSYDMKVHSCTAKRMHSHTLNRCYLYPKQGSSIFLRQDDFFSQGQENFISPEQDVVFLKNMPVALGEAHNADKPAEGYFRIEYDNQKYFDLTYSFGGKENKAELTIQPIGYSDVPLAIGKNERLQRVTANAKRLDTLPYCEYTGTTRRITRTFASRQIVTHKYNCTISLVSADS